MTRLWPERQPRPARSWIARLADGIRTGAVLLLLSVGALNPARAADVDSVQIALQRTTDALLLTARLELAPEAAVESALFKSVPLYFVWQADVYRHRWYWADKRVAGAVRTLRLAYQPLTRRWRLSLSNDAGGNTGGTGLQYALHQNFETLTDALAAVARVSSWKVAEASRLAPGEQHRVEVRFRLDLTLLPRPFQIGMANQPEWTIDVERRLEVPEKAEPDARPESPAVPPTGAEADVGR